MWREEENYLLWERGNYIMAVTWERLKKIQSSAVEVRSDRNQQESFYSRNSSFGDFVWCFLGMMNSWYG